MGREVTERAPPDERRSQWGSDLEGPVKPSKGEKCGDD
jgi:hypothetical protein